MTRRGNIKREARLLFFLLFQFPTFNSALVIPNVFHNCCYSCDVNSRIIQHGSNLELWTSTEKSRWCPVQRSSLTRHGRLVVKMSSPPSDEDTLAREEDDDEGTDISTAVTLVSNNYSISYAKYTWLMVALPALSMIFPVLVDTVQQSTVPEDRRLLIIFFLIIKRVYLYCMAITIVDIAGRKALTVPLELGKRLQQLNDELFSFGGSGDGTNRLRELNKGVAAKEAYQSLDEIDAKFQVVFLPLFLGFALFGSYFFLQLQGSSTITTFDEHPELINSIKNLVQSFGPYWSTFSNAIVCILFTRTEFEAAIQGFDLLVASTRKNTLLNNGENTNETAGVSINETDNDNSISGRLSLALSIVAVIFCYVGPTSFVWPLRNLVNSCLAITVARAIQLPKFVYVAAALVGLVLYDTIGVYATGFLVPSAGAVTDAATAGSVMESVAKSKLIQGGGSSMQFWQPGLLTIAVGGKTTDALGLGDTIFPALLAGWSMRFDKKNNGGSANDDSDVSTSETNTDIITTGPYLQASLGGYVTGCFLCEVFNTGAGQPALLFLIPSMLVSVVGLAIVRNELEDVLSN